MSRPRSLLRSLAEQLGSILDPLTGALQDPERMEQLLARLGVFDASLAGPVTAVQAIAALRTQLEALAEQDDLDYEAARSALQAARTAFELADEVSDLGGGVGVIPGLGRDLLDYLFETWLLMRHPLAREVMVLLTLLDAEPDRPERPPVIRGDEVVRAPTKIDRIRMDRLPALLRDPVAVLKARYVNALATDQDAAAMAERLFPQIVQVLRALGVVCHYGVEPEGEGWLGNSAPLVRDAMVIYAVSGLRSADPESGIVLTLSPISRGDLGLVVSPFGNITFTKQLGRWLLRSTLSGRVDSAAWGRHGLTLLAQDAEIGAEVTASSPTNGATPAYVLGKADGTRVELGSVMVAAKTLLSLQKQSLALSADASRGAIVIAPGDVDGFLASVLPPQGLRTDIDLGIAWSSDTGLTLRGSGSLEASLPVQLSVGGLKVSHVYVGLKAKGDEVRAEVSVTMSLSIGPVKAVVDRLGIDGTLTFPPRGGNLGVADLALGFKMPSGIGLSVEAHGVLSGSGLLFHDRAQSLYAGVLQLSLRDLMTLKALGLIATRLPDGSRGYSLLVFITAEDFRPVQLGLGFTLLGIGGMVGVNRTFDEAVLRQGLEKDALGRLLFPRDPIANATEVIRTVDSAFPARAGSHLIGLLVRIGWGTPTLITADLALILETGARRRLLLLGRVRAMLPSEDHAVLRLQLDAIGVIDFDAGTAALDAVLVDSRLLDRFPITGAAAMRARWSRPRSFALAVGGMRQGFTLPADFPALERVTLSLTTGDNPRVTCHAYFALTSNTVQFGAAAHFYAAAGKFNVSGDAGFDVLIQMSPMHFLAEFFASMQLKRGGTSLFKVKVTGALEGPAPLTVRATCTFEILWWDVSIRVNATLAHGTAPPQPATVDVLRQLLAALRDPRNWSADLPPQRTRVVTLREAVARGAFSVHPLARLTVRQAVVPLNLQRDIDRFGDSPVAGARRFTLGTPRLGGEEVRGTSLRDDFAPAQFFDMSDDDRLAAPQYETMDAGYVLGLPLTAFDLGVCKSTRLEYETIIVDRQGHGAPAPRYLPSNESLALHARFGAAGRSVLRDVPRSAQPFAALRKPGFAVVGENLRRLDGTDLSFAEAQRRARSAPVRARAVPAFEVVG